MLHTVTNVEKQYKSPINTKRAKHKGCVKKVYQGVNVALDHEAKTSHIGKFPHILPNQNNVRSVKIGSQRASHVNTGKKLAIRGQGLKNVTPPAVQHKLN